MTSYKRIWIGGGRSGYQIQRKRIGADRSFWMPLFGACLFVVPLLGSALANAIPTIEPRPMALKESYAAITPLRLQLAPIRFQTPTASSERVEAVLIPPTRSDDRPVVSFARTTLELPAPRETNVSGADERIDVGWRREALREAYSHLGTVYRWGGEEPNGFDCSGFVKFVMEGCGFELPRTAREMHQFVTPIATGAMKPGDLVFFRGPDHIGIYAGSGQFIHASSGSRQVTISSLDQNSYRRRYIGAGRVAE